MRDDYFRDPGALERFNICRNCNSLYSNFAITAKYNNPLKLPLLSHGLKQLIKENPVFQLEIKRTEGLSDLDDHQSGYKNYKLGPSEVINFKDVVEISSDPFSESQLEYMNERRMPVNQGNVTWRIILFTNNYVSFINDHSLFDGESGRNFHVELCKILAKITEESKDLEFVEELYNFDVDGFEKSHPYIDNVVDIYRASIFDFLKLSPMIFLPKSILHWFKYYTTSGFPNYSKYPFFTALIKKSIKTRYKQIHISNQIQQDLLKVLRQHKLTMTAFLDVLFNFCFGKAFSHKFGKPVSLISTIVISGRRYYKELADKLKFQFLVSGADIALEPMEEFNMTAVVDKLKMVNNQIADAIESKKLFKFFGLLDKVNIYDFVKPEEKVNERINAYEISNLGFNNVSFGTWIIEDFVFSQSLGVLLIISTSLISTPNGLNVVIGYADEFKDYPFDDFEDLIHSTIAQFLKQA